MNYFYLVLLALAASRVVWLIAEDTLPFGGLRDKTYNSSNLFLSYVGMGLKCTFCLSVWAGAAAAGLAMWQGWVPTNFWLFWVLWWAYAQSIVIINLGIYVLMGDD